MKKGIIFLTILSMVFNNFILCMGYDDVIQIANSEENENILTETGTIKVSGTTNPYWMADSKEKVLENFVSYTVSASLDKAVTTVTAEDIDNNPQIIGNPVNTGETAFIGAYGNGKDAVVKAPANTFIKRFKYYIKGNGDKTSEIKEGLSVSTEQDGIYTPVSVTVKKLGYVSGFYSNHFIYEVETAEEINCSFVKITIPSSGYCDLGAFEYDYIKIIDLSKVPDGTNKVCGTTNPYWMADSKEKVLENFVSYTVSTAQDKALTTVTAEDIENNPQIIGNPVNTEETAFVGAQGAGKNAVFKAPANTFIKRFKYYIKATGDRSSEIKDSLSASTELDGTYTPVSVTVKKLGYVSGFWNNHFLYEVETAEEINCSFVKITIPSSGYCRLGAFEYDYKINKAAMVLDEIFYEYDDILNGQNRLHVENDLIFPQTIDCDDEIYSIEWISSNENIIEPNGTVHQQAQSEKVKITAKVHENNSLIYSKDYEFIVASIGSSIVFFEDFEDVEINPTDGRGNIIGYNNWTSTLGGENDATDTALLLDPADELNKVMWLNQTSMTDSATSNRRGFDQVSDGKVELSVKHMTTAPTSWFRIGLAGLDMNISQAAIACYGSLSTTFTGIKRVSWQANIWHEYKFVLDIDKKLMSVYYNGEQILSDFLLPESAYLTSAVSISTKRNSNFGNNYFDDICIRDLTPDTSVAVEMEADYLSFPETVSGDIDLPSNGIFDSAIAWSTSDAGVIDNNGIVTLNGEEKDVVLHAIVRNGDYVAERDFNIKVSAAADEEQLTKNEETLQKIANRFSLNKMLGGQSAFNITNDFSVVTEYDSGDAGRLGGCKISWQSDTPEVIGNNGDVSRGLNDKKVTLTAEFSFKEDSSIKVIKSYSLIVAGEGEYTSFYNFDEQQNGESVSVVEGVSISDLSASGIFYGLWQSPDDLLNGVAIASRNQKSNPSSDFVAETNFEGKIVEVGLSFYLPSPNGKIDFKINGIDIPICVTGTNTTVNGKKIDTTVTTKEWHKIAISFNDYNKLLYVYLDGEQISDEGINYLNELNIPSISVSNNNGSIGVWYIDDLYIKDTNISNEEAIRRVLSALEIETEAEWNITLPVVGEYGTRIQWTSDNPDVLNSDGVVFRTVGGDTTVTLTAKVSRETEYDFKELTVLVPGLDGTETPSQDKFEEHVMLIESSLMTDEKSYEITDDLKLFNEYSEGNSAFYGGMDVKWQSDLPSVISDEGKVTQPVIDTGVKITATFTSKRNPEITVQKEYTFIVQASGETVYYEDFESVTSDMIGTALNGFKNEWETEARTAEQNAMNVTFKLDPLELKKPFNDANKALSFNRFKLSDYTQRSYRSFTPAEKKAISDGKSYVMSFKLMFTSPQSMFYWSLGSNYTMYPKQIGGTAFNGKFKDGYTLPENEWHYFTFILCPDDDAIYIMVDGRTDLLDKSYYNFKTGPLFQSICLDIVRNTSVCEVYVDDLSFRVLSHDDDDIAVAGAVSQLSLPSTIENDYIFPSYGENRTTISWTSENHDVILDDGKIVGTGTALIKAVVKRGAATETKEFRVAVNSENSEFVISGINKTENIIDAVTFSRTGDYTDAELILLVYNKGKLSQIRNMQIVGSTVTVEPIDISQYYDCEIKAYVMKKSNIVSNVYCDNYSWN